MRLWLYCIAALLFDWVAFVFWTVLPIQAEEFRATATEIALLQAVSGGIYVLNCVFIGRLADRFSKSALARIGCVIAIAACLVTIKATGLLFLFLTAPILSIGASIFWPAIQGALGTEADPRRMERALGTFNVMWSIGKTLGFAMGGKLDATLHHGWTLGIAAAATLPILFFYPKVGPARPSGEHEADHPDRAVFRTLGYVANFIAFGMGAIFQNQFFKYLDDSGLGGTDRKTFFGVFLGMIFGAQTLVFVALQRGKGWTYRRIPLYLAQALSAGAAVALTLTRHDSVLMAVAPFIGVGIGFAYASSIYYSLHGPSEHGKYAGLHEAVLGSGTVLLPVLGGYLADHLKDLRMPYWLAAGATVVAIAVEETIYRTSARRSSNRSIVKSAPSSSPGLK